MLIANASAADGRRRWLAPVLASLLCVALAAPAITRLSATFDEAGYICLGVQSWYGDPDRLIQQGTLPFFGWVENAAGALYMKAKYGGLPGGSNSGVELDVDRSDHLELMYLARWTNLLLSGLGTVWSVWWVTSYWFGSRAGAAAACFAAIEPNLLAGYVLATNDAPALPFLLLAVTVFHSHLRVPSPLRLLAVGALVGIATAFKVSALPIGLLLMGSWLVMQVWRSAPTAIGAVRGLAKAAPRFLLVDTPVVVLLALLVSWTANGFATGYALSPGSSNAVANKLFSTLGYPESERSAAVAKLQSLRVPAPVSVLRSQLGHGWSGHPMMFLGRVGSAGPWYYYPFVFLLKTHLVFLILGFVSLARREVRRSPLALAVLLLLCLSCTTKLHQGPRYFIVLYGLWAALAGMGYFAVIDLIRPIGARRLAAAVLAAGSLALTLSSAPDYLVHTSPLFGGDSEGYRYADANSDWGQGSTAVFSAVDARGLFPVVYILTGPSIFGIPRDREMIYPRYFEQADELPPRLEYIRETLGRLKGRLVVVGLRSLYGPLPHHAVVPIFRALRGMPPTGRLTNHFVYYDLRDPERFTALERQVEREIPYWDEEWAAGRRAGVVVPGPFSADPRAPREP